jgi:hypothetical protein
MELLKDLNDDQIALLGCAVALFVTGTLMSLSHFIGRARMKAKKSFAVASAAGLSAPAPSWAIERGESERNAA